MYKVTLSNWNLNKEMYNLKPKFAISYPWNGYLLCCK